MKLKGNMWFVTLFSKTEYVTLCWCSFQKYAKRKMKNKLLKIRNFFFCCYPKSFVLFFLCRKKKEVSGNKKKKKMLIYSFCHFKQKLFFFTSLYMNGWEQKCSTFSLPRFDHTAKHIVTTFLYSAVHIMYIFHYWKKERKNETFPQSSSYSSIQMS